MKRLKVNSENENEKINPTQIIKMSRVKLFYMYI